MYFYITCQELDTFVITDEKDNQIVGLYKESFAAGLIYIINREIYVFALSILCS